MRLPLDKLDGARIADLALSVDEQAGASSPHPVTIRARLAADGQEGDRGDEGDGPSWRLFEGQTNPGTAWRHPWLEVRYHPWLGGEEDGEPIDFDDQVGLFETLGSALLPGSYVMLSCDGHPDSLRALTVDVPPACTVLGYLLWAAGARWYKVWYFPEGWREGHEKLQGNLPTDAEHEAKRTSERVEEIEAFLDTELAEEYEACAQRGRRILDEHGNG